MKRQLPLLLALVAAFTGRIDAANANPKNEGKTGKPCSQSQLLIDGNRIWVDKEGTGNTTVVFEAGFGNDSSVWSQIAPKIRAAGVQTFIYDRAGMGKSTIDTDTPYSLENDVHILRTALHDCGIDRRIIFVGHSYGGAIGLIAASEEPQILGLVLIEAVVPGVWSDQEVEKNLQAMRAQYDDIRKQVPELAKVAIPWAEALPQSAKRLNSVPVSDTLPIIEIVAEKGQNDPESRKIWRDAQAKFTAGHPHREYVFAAGSSHKVMADRPELVVKSIQTMINKVNSH
jgi:pimeloyl-ACP methyl ester carboxylesterase